MLILRDFLLLLYNVAVVVVFAWLATSYSSASVSLMHDLSAKNDKDVSIHSYAWKVATVCF